MQRKTCIVLTALAVMVMAGLVHAEAVIYEGFDYEVGNLSGQNGGTGFTGAWAATKRNPQVDLGSKDWGSLPTTGNHARGGAWSAVIRPIGSTLADAGLLANGATLWFSVVFDLEGQNYTNADLNLALGTDQFVSTTFGDRQNLLNDTAEGIGVTHNRGTIQGAYWQDTGAVANVAERTTENSTRKLSAANNDNRALLVGKIDWGADANAGETLTLYAPDTDLNQGTPILDSWVTPALDQSQFDQVVLEFKDTPSMDEIRFGATYDDVIGASTPAQPGDFNSDTQVEQLDLNLLLANWGASTVPAEWTAPFDGLVDQTELNDLLANWGAGVPGADALGAAETSDVPEPATLGLLLIGGLATLRRRR